MNTVQPQTFNIIWQNGSFRNRENLQCKKTAESDLLSLFMRTNEKCNKSNVSLQKRGTTLVQRCIFITNFTGSTKVYFHNEVQL